MSVGEFHYHVGAMLDVESPDLTDPPEVVAGRRMRAKIQERVTS